jgi:hypothetical protein
LIWKRIAFILPSENTLESQHQRRQPLLKLTIYSKRSLNSFIIAFSRDHLNNERYRLNQIRGQIERTQKEIANHEEKLSAQERIRDTFLLRKNSFQAEHAKKIEDLKAKHKSEEDILDAALTAIKSKRATVDQLYENRINDHNEKEQEVAANKLLIEQFKHEQSKEGSKNF